MTESQQLLIQIPAVAWPLLAVAYLCTGEAWVQQRQQDSRQQVPRLRHAAMVTGWPLALVHFSALWWWQAGKALYARLRP